MTIKFRKNITMIAICLLSVSFMGSAAAESQSIYVENLVGGDTPCEDNNSGKGQVTDLIDNVIDSIPFVVWSKDAELTIDDDNIEISNDGELVPSDWSSAGFVPGGCGKRNNDVTYYRNLVCAEMFPKGNGNPESFTATALVGEPTPSTVGSDSYRWSGGIVDQTAMDACCNYIVDDNPDDDGYEWDGNECVLEE